jgi:hypothetical protein
MTSGEIFHLSLTYVGDVASLRKRHDGWHESGWSRVTNMSFPWFLTP